LLGPTWLAPHFQGGASSSGAGSNTLVYALRFAPVSEERFGL